MYCKCDLCNKLKYKSKKDIFDYYQNLSSTSGTCGISWDNMIKSEIRKERISKLLLKKSIH